MKWLRRILLLALALSLALAALLWWGLSTEAGARFALARAIAASGGRLSVAGVSGPLAGPLRLRNARWLDRAAGVDVQVREASVDADLAPLFGASVRLRVLDVSDVQVALTSLPAGEDSALSLGAPLDFVFDGFVIERMRVIQDGALLLDAERVELAGRWNATQLDVQRFALRAAQGHIDAAGAVELRSGYPGSGQASFRWRNAERDHVGSVQAHSDGSSARLMVKLSLPLAAALDADVALTDNYPWTLTLAVPEFDLTQLDATATSRKLSASVHGSGQRLAGSLQGELRVDAYPIRIDPLRFAHADDVLVIEQLLLSSERIPGQAEISGSVQTAVDPLGTALKIAWQSVELPSELAGQVLHSAGQASLTGTTDDFSVAGAFKLGPPDALADFAVALQGSGERLAFSRLALKQPQGGIEGSGEISLGESPAWRLEAKATRFDPAVLLVDWPGAVDFKLAAQGSQTGEQASAALQLDGLSGTLRGRPLSGKADLTLAAGGVLEGSLALRSDASTLNLRGRRGDTTDAELAIASSDLGDWLPGLGGGLNGKFRLRGNWPALAVAGHATGQDLLFGDYRAATLALDADLASLDPVQGIITLSAAKVDVFALHFDTLAFDLNGAREQHRAELRASGADLALEIDLVGRSAAADWHGKLERLQLAPNDLPRFDLAQAADMAWDSAGLALSESCLVGAEARICATLTRADDGTTQASYRIERVALALIRALVAPDAPLRFAGLIDGEGTLSREANKSWIGSARLASANGNIAYPDDAESPLLEYRSLRLDADATSERIHLVAQAELNDGGRFDGELNVDGQRRLSGQVDARLENLRFIELLTSELAAVQGSAAAHYAISGTLDAPRLNGRLALSEFGAELPSLGVVLKDGRVTIAAADAERFTIDGQLASAEGLLTLSGGGSLEDAADLTLSVRGERVLVANVPGARVYASPDLRLQRSADGLQLRGELAIPRADLDLDRWPGLAAPSTSPDVVVVDAANEPAPAAGLPLTIDVAVKLGSGDRARLDEDVDLKGYGLDGSVAGRLRIREWPGRQATGSGELTVTGTYKAYGQNLEIDRGRLLFANSQLDNPGLDLRAVRRLRNITPGLRVTGTALRPLLTVYAEPAMEQSEALSYLITGRPLRALRSGESDMLGTAARALGTATGDLLAKGIGRKLGIDDIGVADDSTLGTAAFTVGKYLSPRLYLSYGVGVFEPGQIVTLRYALTKVWEIEASTGSTESRAGINYRIER